MFPPAKYARVFYSSLFVPRGCCNSTPLLLRGTVRAEEFRIILSRVLGGAAKLDARTETWKILRTKQKAIEMEIVEGKLCRDALCPQATRIAFVRSRGEIRMRSSRRREPSFSVGQILSWSIYIFPFAEWAWTRGRDEMETEEAETLVPPAVDEKGRGKGDTRNKTFRNLLQENQIFNLGKLQLHGTSGSNGSPAYESFLPGTPLRFVSQS